MSNRLGKHEAEAEALRLADEFIAASPPADGAWGWECGPARPRPGLNGRKTFLRWDVSVRWKPKDGGVLDGGPPGVHVDLETGEVGFL